MKKKGNDENGKKNSKSVIPSMREPLPDLEEIRRRKKFYRNK